METSSRNSEVIHAGIYYPIGSLKARSCVAGRDALYLYAHERGIPHRRCGKLIVANGRDSEVTLAGLAERARAARAGEIRRLDRDAIAALEPDVEAEFGLFSPLTGIIDSHALMLAYLGDLEDAGGAFARGTQVTSIVPIGDRFRISLADGGRVEAHNVVNAAGLHSGRVAAMVEGLAPIFQPSIRFARGVYFRAEPAPRFRHLVYPLPTQASLGVHATIDLGGGVRFGPDVEWIEAMDDYHVDPGRAADFQQGVAEYYPEIANSRLVPDYAGIRPKLGGPDQPPSDFRIDGPADHGMRGLICLHGIESPGLTASLPLGELVANRLFEAPLAR